MYDPNSCGCTDGTISYAWDPSMVSGPTGPYFNSTYYAMEYPGCEYGINAQDSNINSTGYTCATSLVPSYNAVQCLPTS